MLLVDSAADVPLPSSVLDWMVKMETEFNELKQNLTETQDTLKVTESALKDTRVTLKVTESALKDTQATVKVTESALKDTQATVKVTESALNDTRATLKVTESALKVTQTALKVTQIDLKDTQTDLKDTQTDLKDTQLKLEESRTQTARLEMVVEDTQSELLDTQSQLQDSEVRITELENDKTRPTYGVQENNVISSSSGGRNSRGTGPDCVLGSRYGYEEYIDVYAYGDPVPLGIIDGGPFECLNRCYITPDCEGVNIDTVSDSCDGLMNVFHNNTNEGWGYYKLVEPDECIVNDDPAVIFQATISADHYYPAGEIVVWDTVRVDTTGDLGSDGKYRCSVSGVYSFTMEGISYTNNYDMYFYIMHENTIVKRIINVYGASVLASGTVYIDCVAGDYVWVQSYVTYSGLEGSYWQSTFSGFLLSMKV